LRNWGDWQAGTEEVDERGREDEYCGGPNTEGSSEAIFFEKVEEERDNESGCASPCLDVYQLWMTMERRRRESTHRTPYARPLRLINHSSTNCTAGQ
jgi:hypothetical protein